MRKRTKFVLGVGLAVGAMYATKMENRQMVLGQLGKVVDTVIPWTDDDYIINLGKPDETRDANMVDEGALTSIQYYYDLRDKASKKAQ